MSDPYDPPRPRDYALEAELESLRQQEREGHTTPAQQRRVEELERRLHADERGAEARERQEHNRETGHEGEDQAEVDRHRR
jgi:hypothetical protein